MDIIKHTKPVKRILNRPIVLKMKKNIDLKDVEHLMQQLNKALTTSGALVFTDNSPCSVEFPTDYKKHDRRATFVGTIHLPDFLYFSMAVQNPKEQFKKKKGVQICKERLKHLTEFYRVDIKAYMGMHKKFANTDITIQAAAHEFLKEMVMRFETTSYNDFKEHIEQYKQY